MTLNEKICHLLDTDEGFDNKELADKIESVFKDFVKEELQDLLDSGCHPEHLPEKIREAIRYIDEPYQL